jgi:uncharacterized membrane protein
MSAVNVRIKNLLERLRTSYWFVPSLMLGASTGLAYGAIALDAWRDAPKEGKSTLFYSGDLSSAQALLSMVGGSAITVAGVVFSITITALTLASSQFGPRLLRNFMRDRGNQVVLGTFVSTFLYCLLIQRSLGGGSVPHLSVTVGVVLGIASMCVLVYFIHHVSSSIQASSIVAHVGRELLEGINTVYPEQLGKEIEDKRPKDLPTTQACALRAKRTGYLQAMDEDGLLAIATRNDLVVDLHVRPGAFITEGDDIADIYPTQGATEDRQDQIRETFILGHARSAEQDIEYSINQLVEICLRALSPGINDPLTAMTCIDWLGAAMTRLAHRKIPSSRRYDQRDMLRVIAPRTTFGGAMDAAFNQPRQAGASHPAVMIRILDALATAARQCQSDACREVVARHVLATWKQSLTSDPLATDQADLLARRDAALRACQVAIPSD